MGKDIINPGLSREGARQGGFMGLEVPQVTNIFAEPRFLNLF